MKKWMLVLVAGLILALPANAYAVTSFVGTLTAGEVLESGAGLMPYFLPVVGIVVGIAVAVWAINWLIGKVRGSLGGGGGRRRK